MIINKLIQSRWLWLVLAVLSAAWFLVWLGHPPLVIQDEGRYVGIAREMMRQQEWVVPWFNGVPFFDKPIMYYWLEIIGLKVGGFSAFGARLSQAVMGIAGVVMTFHTARRLFSPQVALLSWLFLAVSPLYFLLSHYADMDLEVAVFIGLSLMSFILAQQADSSKSARRYYMWLCYAMAGCAIMTKGFMGIVFPAMVAGLWVLFTQQWSVLKRLHLFTGITILLAINLPWNVMMEMRFPDYWHYFFYQLQFARYFASNFSHIEPFWFYVPVLLVGALPVSLLCLSRLFHWRALTLTALRANANQTFFLVWFVSIFLFFSVAHTKLIGYMIPVLPAVAVLSALALSNVWQGKQKLPRFDCAVLVIGFVLIAGLLFSIPKWQPGFADMNSAGFVYMLASAFLLAAVGGLYCYLSNRPRALLLIAAVAIMLLNLTVLLCPAISRTNLPMYQAAKPYITADTQVVMYHNYYYDASFYLDRKFVLVGKWYKKIPDFQDSWQWRMEYGARQPKVSGGSLMINDKAFQQLWQSATPLVVFLDQPSYQQLASTLKPKPVVLLKYYDHMVVIKSSMAKS
ncbi:MAG: glycosyltransferase family 39 protein [Coxiellaceae bacterium]|nr:glycosyltransferase family 39 protein [Coxiellaceae bacterium]